MAFNTTADRALAISIDLSGLVSSRINSVVAVRNRERALAESKFQKTVIDQGLSYEAQIDYRKEQIASERKKVSPDNDYIKQLELSLSDIRKLNRFKKVREDYLTSYESLKLGKINLQTHATFLEDLIKNAQDEDAKQELRDELSKVRAEIGQSEIDTLNNRVLVAQKDGTVNILSKTIDDVVKRKAFADLAGNAEESSAWDISLTSLRKQLEEVRITQETHDMDFEITRKGGNALDKLERLNAKASLADDKTPITVDGRQYNSAKEFWTGQRDMYLSGVGTGVFSDFFGDLEKEVQDKIDTVSKVNAFGFIPIPTLDAIKTDYQRLALKPELQPFINKLTTSQTAALNYGVGKAADAIAQSSVATLQLNTGLAKLGTLEQNYGINLAAAKENLNQSIIQKGSQLPSIKEAGKNLLDVGAETPSPTVPVGTTPNEVFQSNTQPQVITPTTPTTPATPPATPPPSSLPKFNKSSSGFSSIVDYLKAQNYDSSFQSRAKLYEQAGLGKLGDFKGLADQNLALLSKFK